MNAWIMVIMLASTDDAKMSVFKTEEECMKQLPTVIEQNKDNPEVVSIGCYEGRVLKGK